jgi:GT2 family glycosyltransferase
LVVGVSVVIATYNRLNDLAECLRSLFDEEVKPYEVIVVDSNSTDGTENLKDHFPIKFLSLKERNRQRARNLGISAASGDVVAFLDDDVIVHKEWLKKISEPYMNDDGVGGVGGRAIPYGASERFYVSVGRNEVGRVFRNGLVIGNFDMPLKNLVEVDSFIGCNMSFRRGLLLRAGGFDENYLGTGYRDDTDLCLRVRKFDHKLLYQSKALVWHKFRGKHVGSAWSYWYVRNQVYFYMKNMFVESKSGFPLFVYRMFFPPRDYVLKSGVKLNIEPALISKVLRGLIDGYRTWRIYTG